MLTRHVPWAIHSAKTLWASVTLVGLALAASLSVPLLLLANMSSTVADDYFYFAQIEQAGSPLRFAWEHYITQNGRFVQALSVGVAYSVFGVGAVKVVPILLYLSLVATLAWNLRLVLPFSERPWVSSVSFAGSLCALALVLMPSFFDVFLWLTSSTVYLGSIVMLLVGSGLTAMIVQRPTLRWRLTPFAAVVLLAGQLFSEPTALFALGAWGLLLLGVVIARQWKLLPHASLLWGSLLAGLLLSLFSPGTIARRGIVGESLDLVGSMSAGLAHYGYFASAMSPWALLMLLAVVLLAALNLDTSSFSRRRLLVGAGAILALGAGSTYGVFLASEVGSSYYPLRNYALPVFGCVVFGSLFLTFLLSLVLTRWDRVRTAWLGFLGVAVCLLAASPFLLNFWSLHASGLALRGSMIEHRIVAIEKQLKSGVGTVAVAAAPVLVRSEAVDVLNPYEVQVEWVVGPIRKLMSIPESARLSFEQTPASYCLPASNRVKPEFICS